MSEPAGFEPAGQGARSASALREVMERPAVFRPDSRFAENTGEPEAPPPPAPVEPAIPEVDPVAEAYAAGFDAGFERARADAEEREARERAAREGIALSFARLDAQLEEELRMRLGETVAALCEAAIAPYALDAAMLEARVKQAASMLARADDERVIRLHPDDIALLSPQMKAEWQVQPEPSLERGTIRVEAANGGVEDGPATWRLAIAEALHQC